MIAIKLTAPHDENGNPQRLYLVVNEFGEMKMVHDEGYGGWPELKLMFNTKFEGLPRLFEGPTIQIDQLEYDRWTIYGREREIYSY